MRVFSLSFFLFFLLLSLTSADKPNPHYNNNNNNNNYDNNIASPSYIKENLGTKKNYAPRGAMSTHTPPPPQCRLYHMEYIARHGTREPTTGWITKFNTIQDNIQNFIQQGGQFNPGYEWMATWKNPYLSGMNGLLSTIGQEEHYNTSKRMVEEYPLMNLTYNPYRFHFQETQVSRTGVSASSYAYGVYEGKGTLGPNKYAPPFIYSNNKNEDPQLRFFGCCPEYKEEVLDNRTAYEQAEIFASTLNKNALALSKRLGTFPIWIIDSPQFLSMWELCRMEASLENDYTQFCTIFTENDVDDLAFREDLEFYWKRGYGHSLSYEIVVDLMKDVFNNINVALEKMNNFLEECRLRGGNGCEDKVKNIPYQLAGAFRFGHAETMIPTLTWMGFFYTPPNLMMADTPKSERDTRAWKTTQISTYSTNLDFNIYVCGEGEGKKKGRNEEEVLVKVLHDEGEMALPWCGGDVYCSWDDFQAHYADLLSLDFNTLCN